MRKAVAVAATGALLLGSASAAFANHTDPMDTGVCPAPGGDESFDDVSDGTFAELIECMGGYGITEGFPDGEYKPDLSITRGQMAQFVFELVETAAPGTLNADAENTYDDVEDGATFEDAISALTEAGIVQGDGDGNFNPGDNVRRDEMAQFIDGAIEAVTGESLADESNDDAFDDDDGNIFEPVINGLAAEHIVSGTGGGDYSPAADVNRGQMSAFIMQAAGYLATQGMWAPTEPTTNQTFSVDVADTQIVDTADSAGLVEYEFSGLDPDVEHDVFLFPCVSSDEGAQIFSDGQPVVGPGGHSRLDGTITFHDESGGTNGAPDDVPDNEGSTQNSEADLLLVGTTGSIGSDASFDHMPDSDGTLRVIIEGDGDVDCTIPVVVEDPASDDNDSILLGDDDPSTLENDNEPIAPFGVGPAAVFMDGSGENADEPDTDMEFVGDASLFPDGMLGTGDDVGVVFDDHGDSLFGIDFDADGFYYDGAEAEGSISASLFENYLTNEDNLATCDSDDACNNLDTPYTMTGQNNWVIDIDELPSPPTNVTTTSGDLDGEDDGDDVEVAFDAPAFDGGLGGNVDQYCVELYDVDDLTLGPLTGCTDEVDTLATGDAPTTVQVDDVSPATYRARVYAESETDDFSGFSLWSDELTIVGPPGPTIEDAVLTTDAVVVEAADTGDLWTLTFSEDMTTPVAGDTLTLTDADGDLILVDCTGTAAADNVTDATCTETSPGVITVDLLEEATDRNAGGDGDILYPLTITDTDGFTDAADGVETDVAGSADVVVDDES